MVSLLPRAPCLASLSKPAPSLLRQPPPAMSSSFVAAPASAWADATGRPRKLPVAAVRRHGHPRPGSVLPPYPRLLPNVHEGTTRKQASNGMVRIRKGLIDEVHVHKLDLGHLQQGEVAHRRPHYHFYYMEEREGEERECTTTSSRASS
ncbi:hypothetical protein HU200_009987 [Digitaria exilis]|uniref:Uncharacterized protein n=1 Tax=Digitaria exilis TaxID=1010633 RepID=A0A835FID7_9POAL|nr:hypothetical protein HU200_009987 [Digitaria exilis]